MTGEILPAVSVSITVFGEHILSKLQDVQAWGGRSVFEIRQAWLHAADRNLIVLTPFGRHQLCEIINTVF